jgi:hypothetical protein
VVWADRTAKRTKNYFYIFNMMGIIGMFPFIERVECVFVDAGCISLNSEIQVLTQLKIGGYIVIIILTFLYRVERLSPTGQCIIGVQNVSGWPLASYETGINLYLSFLFLWPLRKVYSYTTRKNTRLRAMAKRCLIGTSITTITTGANLVTVVALDGENGWMCIMLCNLDSMFFLLSTYIGDPC